MLGIRHSRKPRTIAPPIWEPRRGCARVLVENPDGAEVWAHTEALQEAGYDVATCFGPSVRGRVVCPLVSEGNCTAVEEADVVITTTSLDDDRAVIAALCYRHPKGLIVEGADADEPPVDQARLLAAVEDALAS